MDPERLRELRQTSKAAFAASSFSSWFILFSRFLKILVALNKEKAQVLVSNFVKLSAKFG